MFAVGNDWDRAVARTPTGCSLLDQVINTSAGDMFWSQSTNSPTGAAGSVAAASVTRGRTPMEHGRRRAGRGRRLTWRRRERHGHAASAQRPDEPIVAEPGRARERPLKRQTKRRSLSGERCSSLRGVTRRVRLENLVRL